MATQALPRRRASRKKKRSLRWHAWWPLLLAVVATPFALKAAEILPLMGPGGLIRLRFLYPLALLAQQHLGLREAAGETASQALMYLQFPLYALLLILIHRTHSFRIALLTVLMLHLLAAAAVWLLPSV